jgi:hypothetical protein
MKKIVFLATAGLVGVSFGTLHAAAISGSFNLDGSITVNNGPPQVITWADNANTANRSTIATSGLIGSFLTAALGNTEVSIATLTSPPDVVDGSGFAATPFITFLAPSASAFPILEINFINPGPFTAAACSANPALAVVGQTCTLPGSPFGFTNLGTPGQPVTGSSAAFSFSGITSDGLDTWTGNFTSQFGPPPGSTTGGSYQSVLATLQTTGSVTNTFSGTFNVVLTPTTPEPSGMLLLGAGLLLVAFGAKRFKAQA